MNWIKYNTLTWYGWPSDFESDDNGPTAQYINSILQL